MKIRPINWILFSLLLMPLAAGCGGKNNRNPKDISRNVILVRPEMTGDSVSTTYPGIVEEGSSIAASFMADGKIASINVKEGDRVRKGQLLASLDDSDYRIGYSQLEAQYNQMTKEKERMDAMFERHNIAPNDYEKFTAGYEQLKLQLDMMKRKLDYTRLNSPADGYVAAKYLNPGELTGAGTPVFNIVDDSKMVASLDLPVKVFLDRNNIEDARGEVPGIKGTIPLSIESFTPDADNNMLYHMKLSIPASYAKGLTPGMNISVNLTSKESSRRGTLIPSRAVFTEEDRYYVWVFNPQDSTLNKKEIRIEGTPVNNRSIVAGLDGDELIVETGVKQLYEGEKVNVLSKTQLGI